MMSPVINIGRYAGKRIDQLPNSYLRWMVTQDFPKLWLDAALAKLAQSQYSDNYISVSRHALDMFSLRFMHLWNRTLKEPGEKTGFATFVARLAEEAWVGGVDVSKHRHQDDGTVKQWQGIKWVFHVGKYARDYKDVVTVMSAEEELSTDKA